MKSKNLEDFTFEDLIKQQKSIKVITGMLAGMLLVLLVSGIYLTFQKVSYVAFIVIPLALFPIVLLNLTTLKNIKKELHSRQ